VENNFKPFCFISGKLQVEWECLDEDQQDNKPGDEHNLRANLMAWNGKEWVQPQDASFCTMAGISTPRQLLEDASYALIQIVNQSGGVSWDDDEPRYRSAVMENWTWTEYNKEKDVVVFDRHPASFFRYYKYIRER
jgi:hypothetical protein